MALSEEALALVASNLTAAHCAVGPRFNNLVAERTMANYVRAVFEAHKMALASGSVEHFNAAPPSQDEQPAAQ